MSSAKMNDFLEMWAVRWNKSVDPTSTPIRPFGLIFSGPGRPTIATVRRESRNPSPRGALLKTSRSLWLTPSSSLFECPAFRTGWMLLHPMDRDAARELAAADVNSVELHPPHMVHQ